MIQFMMADIRGVSHVIERLYYGIDGHLTVVQAFCSVKASPSEYEGVIPVTVVYSLPKDRSKCCAKCLSFFKDP